MEMYSIYNKGKAVVAERLIRTLKNKIYKHTAAILSDVYFDMLYDLVKKYNNTVHRTIGMKLVDFDLTSDSYAEYNGDSNEKYPKLKAGDRVRISKYKNNFAEGHTPNCSE